MLLLDWRLAPPLLPPRTSSLLRLHQTRLHVTEWADGVEEKPSSCLACHCINLLASWGRWTRSKPSDVGAKLHVNMITQIICPILFRLFSREWKKCRGYCDVTTCASGLRRGGGAVQSFGRRPVPLRRLLRGLLQMFLHLGPFLVGG